MADQVLLFPVPAELRNQIYDDLLSETDEIYIATQREMRKEHRKELVRDIWYRSPSALEPTSRATRREFYDAISKRVLDNDVRIVANVHNFDFANTVKYLEHAASNPKLAASLRTTGAQGQRKLVVELAFSRPQDFNSKGLSTWLKVCDSFDTPFIYRVRRMEGDDAEVKEAYDAIVSLEVTVATLAGGGISQMTAAVIEYCQGRHQAAKQVVAVDGSQIHAPTPGLGAANTVFGTGDGGTAALLGGVGGEEDDEGMQDEYFDEDEEDEDDDDMNMSDTDDDGD